MFGNSIDRITRKVTRMINQLDDHADNMEAHARSNELRAESLIKEASDARQERQRALRIAEKLSGILE